MRFREQIEVTAPLAEAFAYTADFANAQEWDPGIVESKRQGDGPPGVGTVYDVVAVFRGRRQPFRYEVREYVPNRRVVLVGEGAQATSADTVDFEATATGTTITYEADLRLKGLRRLAEPVLGRAVAEMGAAALAGLRTKLDARR